MLQNYMPTLYEIIISFCALIFLTVKDIKTKEINLWICLAVFLLAIVEPGKNYLNGLYGLLLGFIPLFILARFGNGGDGDAVVGGSLGALLGARFISYSLIVAYVIYVIVLMIVVVSTKDKTKQLPFVPFILAGWLVIIIQASVENHVLGI